MRNKNGFTLVEVMAVVAIIGILSAMGVAGLSQAVANQRTKAAARDAAAFLERITNESGKLSETLCIYFDNNQDTLINVYRTTNCNSKPDSSLLVATLNISLPVVFDHCNGVSGLPDNDWLKWDSKTNFIPNRGLSAAPKEGHVCVKYKNSDNYGAAVKKANSNKIKVLWGFGTDATKWSEI